MHKNHKEIIYMTLWNFTASFEEEILEGKRRKGMKMPEANVSGGGQRKHRDPEGRMCSNCFTESKEARVAGLQVEDRDEWAAVWRTADLLVLSSIWPGSHSIIRELIDQMQGLPSFLKWFWPTRSTEEWCGLAHCTSSAVHKGDTQWTFGYHSHSYWQCSSQGQRGGWGSSRAFSQHPPALLNCLVKGWSVGLMSSLGLFKSSG